jgi:hypothetical protein
MAENNETTQGLRREHSLAVISSTGQNFIPGWSFPGQQASDKGIHVFPSKMNKFLSRLDKFYCRLDTFFLPISMDDWVLNGKFACPLISY